jgi:hypothetical protein
MLKINLLPPYIHEGAKRRTAFLLWLVLIVIAAAGVSGYRYSLDQQANSFYKQAEERKPVADEAMNTEQKKNNVIAEAKAVTDKWTFVKNAGDFNRTTYPPRVTNVIDYTISKVLYSSFSPQGQSISLDALAPTVADVCDYLMWMEHNPEISNVSISMDALPDFPVADEWLENEKAAKADPGNLGHRFGVLLTLVKPIPMAGPTYPAGGGAAGMSTAGGGAPGIMGGFGGRDGALAGKGMGSTPGGRKLDYGY